MSDNDINSNYRLTINEISGLDLVSFYIGDEDVVGYFETSPVEQRIIKVLDYKPVADNTQKPYRAHWMISDSKLYLGYVNGIVNGKRFYTTDVVSDFPDDDILHFFSEFSGKVKLIVQQRELSKCFMPYMDVCGKKMILSFKDGRLINHNSNDLGK